METERSYFYVFDSQAGTEGPPADRPGVASHARSLTLDRVKSWSGIGALWGGILGLLLAPTNVLSFLPGLGLASRGGPWSVALVGSLEGALLIGALLALGAVLTRRKPPAAATDKV